VVVPAADGTDELITLGGMNARREVIERVAVRALSLARPCD